MARSVRQVNLETRAARSKLKVQKKPYWRMVDKNCYLGYYKGKKGGSWCAKVHHGNSKYSEEIIAVADDVQDADNLAIFDFYQAQKKAREWFALQTQIQAGGSAIVPKTVEEAGEEYLRWFEANKKPYAYKSTKQAIRLHIYPELGKIALSKLTARRIEQWLEKLASTPPRIRSKTGAEVKFQKAEYDKRARKNSAKRHLNTFKAILNFAYKHKFVSTDEAWKHVRPFKGVDQPKIRWLSIEECKDLLNACEDDFKNIVRAALYTGCRYGEIARLKAEDFNLATGKIHIQESKSGKARYISLNADGTKFFDLKSKHKKPQDFLFLKDKHFKWGKSHQHRPMKDACIAAKIKPSINFHVLRHTYAAHLAMAGVTLQVIAAQLGHSDTRICEKHYAHLCPNYIDNVIKEKSLNLGFVEESNIRALKLV